MKIQSAEFILGAVKKEQFPQDLPEIAVVGRSNVGKSSLLNFLLGRKKLVSFSRTPGKTRQINYFKINGTFYFVDIPGFGYAKMGKGEQEAMLKSIESYFTSSRKIAGILFLFDIRVRRSKVDEESLEWVSQFGLPMLFLATKGDKLKFQEIKKAKKELQDNYSLQTPPLITSSVKKTGSEEVWSAIQLLLDG